MYKPTKALGYIKVQIAYRHISHLCYTLNWSTQFPHTKGWHNDRLYPFCCLERDILPVSEYCFIH